ncbi:MAG: hypothetical protein HC812_06415 [Leptolyngbya sp. RL_3_1]|nr:hypothetical protein [Leptolyngbya sp. RL_3_1]
MPLLDNSTLMANGSFTTFAMQSTTLLGRQQSMGVYRRNASHGAITSLWAEQGDALESVAVTLYGDWVWAVQNHAMVGWYQNCPPAKLAATSRERLIYSPTGHHYWLIAAKKRLMSPAKKCCFG